MFETRCLVFDKQMTLEANMISGGMPLLISKLGIMFDTRRNHMGTEALDESKSPWRDVLSVRSGNILLSIDDFFLEGESLEEVLAVFNARLPVWRSRKAIGVSLMKLHWQF